MKIAVLSNPDGWHYRDLARANQGRCELVACPFGELSTLLADPGFVKSATTRLTKVDCVFARAMPSGSLQQIVFRMDLLQQLERAGVPVVNSAKTIEASVDKYLSLALMKDHGLPVPATGVFQLPTEAVEIFEQLGGDVVVKPLFGSQGRGLLRVTTATEMLNIARQIIGDDEVCYVQEFIETGNRDLRLLVVGEEVFAMSRENPESWITNATRGATCRPHDVTDGEIVLAKSAATAVGGKLIGVDLAYDRQGQPFVLEVNASPGWAVTAETLQMDIAEKVLLLLLKQASCSKLSESYSRTN